jgi:hypothetical protein
MLQTFLQYLRFCPLLIGFLLVSVLFLAVTSPIDFIISKIEEKRFAYLEGIRNNFRG